MYYRSTLQQSYHLDQCRLGTQLYSNIRELTTQQSQSEEPKSCKYTRPIHTFTGPRLYPQSTACSTNTTYMYIQNMYWLQELSYISCNQEPSEAEYVFMYPFVDISAHDICNACFENYNGHAHTRLSLHLV